MNQKNVFSSIKPLGFRVFRLVGVLLIIYVSMIFYLALTERQNAFPRAIPHKEARASIQGKAHSISCTLEDGVLLEGWSKGTESTPVLLYYPDANEDAAQFLAEVDSLAGFTIVTFNYRGSGNNKGTPSQETFENDAEQIAECATQVHHQTPAIVAGRGTGAILAANQKKFTYFPIFIDPVFSIADAVSSKYKALYPKFLVRANVSVNKENLEKISNSAVFLYDRRENEARTNIYKEVHSSIKVIKRENLSLQQALQSAIKP